MENDIGKEIQNVQNDFHLVVDLRKNKFHQRTYLAERVENYKYDQEVEMEYDNLAALRVGKFETDDAK